MSDMPKTVPLSGNISWVLLGAALLLTVVICRREALMEKRIIQAIREKRMANIANLMEEDGNVRWINRKNG